MPCLNAARLCAAPFTRAHALTTIRASVLRKIRNSIPRAPRRERSAYASGNNENFRISRSIIRSAACATAIWRIYNRQSLGTVHPRTFRRSRPIRLDPTCISKDFARNGVFRHFSRVKWSFHFLSITSIDYICTWTIYLEFGIWKYLCLREHRPFDNF